MHGTISLGAADLDGLYQGLAERLGFLNVALELFDEDALSSDDLIGVLEPKKLIQLLAELFYKDAQSSDDLTQLLASSVKHSICKLSL